MIVLHSKNAKVVIDPKAGGRISSLNVFGYELLKAAVPEPMLWGCYPMVPWAGRIRNGQFNFKNRLYQLPKLMPPHAIHGTTFLKEWKQDCESQMSVSLGKDWPFPGRAIQRFKLDDDRLHLRLEIHTDDKPFPCSIGWHPWFRRRLNEDGGEVELLFDAESMYIKDNEGIPIGATCAPTEGPWDDCFSGLSHPPRLIWPKALQIELHSSAQYWVIYNEREDAVCVEPQTAPPNSLNNAPELATPDKPLVMEFSIVWRRLY